MATSPSRPDARPMRRRQRSVRVSVAVILLSLATAVVVVALPSQSPVWLSAASVVTLVLGWAAARIVYTELVQSRRDAAADRAGQAKAYRSLFTERATDHAAFTSLMVERMARRDHQLHELTGKLVEAKQLVAETEGRVVVESDRADEAERTVAELREELAVDDADPGGDLMAWESRASAVDAEPQHKAG